MLTNLLSVLFPVVTCTLQILSNLGDSSFTVPANDTEVKSNEAAKVKFLIVLVVLIVFLHLFIILHSFKYVRFLE